MFRGLFDASQARVKPRKQGLHWFAVHHVVLAMPAALFWFFSIRPAKRELEALREAHHKENPEMKSDFNPFGAQSRSLVRDQDTNQSNDTKSDSSVWNELQLMRKKIQRLEALMKDTENTSKGIEVKSNTQKCKVEKN